MEESLERQSFWIGLTLILQKRYAFFHTSMQVIFFCFFHIPFPLYIYLFQFLVCTFTDHFPGLNSQFQCKSRIYCSTITRELLIHRFPFLPRELIIDLPVEEPIHLSWGEETSVTVTAIDASHCPGSLMFLFVGRFPEFSSLLYTGDFRYENTSLLQQSPTLSGYLAGSGVNKLDWLIFDSTFCEQTQKFSFPSRDEAIDIAAQKINQLVIYNKVAFGVSLYSTHSPI